MHIVHTQGVQLPPQLTIWGFKWALHHANVKIDVCKHRSGRFNHTFILLIIKVVRIAIFCFALMKSSMCTLLRREESSPRELNSHDLASIDRYPAEKQFSLHTVQCTSDLFKRYNAFTELALHWSIGLCAIFGIPSCHCFRSVSGVAMATDTVATFTKKMNIDTHTYIHVSL